MTREEAQDRLQRMRNQAAEFVESSPSHYWSDIYRKDAEAIEMAIEALSEKSRDCDTCKHGELPFPTDVCEVCCDSINCYERAER